MRSRLFSYSMGLIFCLASLTATVPSCSGGESGSEEPQPSDALPSDRSAAHISDADRIAALGRLPKVDRPQLTALLGDRVPAAAGDACSNLGSQCSPNVNAIVRECGGFAGVCGSTGTEDVVPLQFFCLPVNGAGVCTAVESGPQQTISCTVPSDGKPCSTGCNPDVCDAYSSSCDAETNEIRKCFSGGTCSNNTCINQTSTTTVVGTCSRETEGLSCTTSELPPSTTCSPPRAPICNVNHLCACLLGAQ